MSVIGPLDKAAKVWVNTPNGLLRQVRVRNPNSSLASQALGPPESDLEMSFFNRPFPLLGRKLLSLTPLGMQKVDPADSVLGGLSRAGSGLTGINLTYSQMIRQAFKPRYWKSSQRTPEGYTQMEANFSLFFGLAVQLYESTLVSDQTPFDRFMAVDYTALTQEQLHGLLAFINFADPTQVPGRQFADLFTGVSQGACVTCHFGAEFTTHTVSVIALAGTGVEVDIVPAIDANGFNHMAPFDHPEPIVPNGGTFRVPAAPIVVPAVGAGGRPAAGLPPLGTFLGLDPFTP